MKTSFIEKEPTAGEPPPSARSGSPSPRETAYGYPRNFLNHRFVYVVVSPRARGLSLGVNFNPDKACNFDCPYCEVNRAVPGRDSRLDVEAMAAELTQSLQAAQSGQYRELPLYRTLPADLLQLRHVTLSGDGEPTLAPNFAEAVEAVVHVRARGQFPFFKLVLVTNASGLGRPEVKQGLRLLTTRDEIWAKLDAGTQEWMDRINRAQVPLSQILQNILELGRQRPIVIQSLFAELNGVAPPPGEIDAYAHRLLELKQAGAQIIQVQIYSATRPTPHSECDHLPLRSLSQIAQTVRQVAGLKAEVF